MNRLPLVAACRIATTAIAVSASIARADHAPDFNNDGWADFAIGAPYRTVNGADSAGSVNVVWGTSAGFVAGPDIDQETPFVTGVSEPDDRFGQRLAWGDFDADGFSDLVVGSPYEDFDDVEGPAENVGLVYVFPGSDSGPRTDVSYTIDLRDSPSFGGYLADYTRFGHALAAGDYNGDGFEDLAIGAPGQPTAGPQPVLGAVYVFYGSSSALSWDDYYRYDPSFRDDDGPTVTQHGLGFSLAAGDFDCDGLTELAAGAPEGSISGQSGGLVYVWDENDNNPGQKAKYILHQGLPGIPGAMESGDRFGFSLAAGDAQGTGCANLAIGIPYEDIGSIVDAGYVEVISSSSNGFVATTELHQDITGVAGSCQAADHFGWSLGFAKLNNDSKADLIVGAPDEDVGQTDDGAIAIFKGSSAGIITSGNVLWDQGTAGIPSTNEFGDEFGLTVSGDTRTLFVGVPGQGVSGVVQAGMFITLRLTNTASFAVSSGSTLFQADFTGANSQFARFGNSMTTM